nr:hypothetical protein [Gammaproteobacteria bacterium]NIT64579.1 hypothetical protein [Gammaproteobacteria bacterium]NIV21538.1 hypothetical protein [Gammaproteobacteria bacterium]NIY33159.1 hypothetical protein [Gammaproteobacteria bacterium]
MTDRFASAAGEARFRRRPLAAVLLTASLLPAALHAAEGERLDIQEVIISEEMTLSRETSIGKMDVPVAETP